MRDDSRFWVSAQWSTQNSIAKKQEISAQYAGFLIDRRSRRDAGVPRKGVLFQWMDTKMIGAGRLSTHWKIAKSVILSSLIDQIKVLQAAHRVNFRRNLSVDVSSSQTRVLAANEAKQDFLFSSRPSTDSLFENGCVFLSPRLFRFHYPRFWIAVLRKSPIDMLLGILLGASLLSVLQDLAQIDRIYEISPLQPSNIFQPLRYWTNYRRFISPDMLWFNFATFIFDCLSRFSSFIGELPEFLGTLDRIPKTPSTRPWKPVKIVLLLFTCLFMFSKEVYL